MISGPCNFTKEHKMADNTNKRIGKFCRVCDNELYETDTKDFKRKLHNLHVVVVGTYTPGDGSYRVNEICHGCIVEAVVRGEILEK